MTSVPSTKRAVHAAAAMITGMALISCADADVTAAKGCPTVETRDPNAAGQVPAFPDQTRACAVRSDVAFDVVVLAKGLQQPWAVEPLPGGDLLVTEKPGRMRIVSADGKLGAPITGVPPVDARGQGGLLDVALSPDFATDRTIYWSFSEPRNGGNATSVARGVLSTDGTQLEAVRLIFRACRRTPATSTTARGSCLARTECSS